MSHNCVTKLHLFSSIECIKNVIVGASPLLLLIIWLIGIIYFVTTWKSQPSETKIILQIQYDEMIKYIQRLEEEKEHLKLLKKQDDNRLKKNLTITKTLKEPSKEYEVSRRTIKRDVSDMWLFLRHQLESLLEKEGILGTKEEQQLKTIVRDPNIPRGNHGGPVDTLRVRWLCKLEKESGEESGEASARKNTQITESPKM